MMAGDFAGVVMPWFFIVLFATVGRAFHSVNKFQIELQEKDGRVFARLLQYFIRRPEWLHGTVRTGNVFCIAWFTLAMTAAYLAALPPDLSSLAAAGWGALMIVLVVLLVNMAQHVVAALLVVPGANRVLAAVAFPFACCAVLLSPLTYLAQNLYRFWSRRMYGVAPATPLWPAPPTVPAPLRATDAPASIAESVLQHAMALKHVRIRDCMIPRTEITAVEVDESVDMLRAKFAASGFSRIIVYRNTIDDVVGYCSAAALLHVPQRIADAVIPVLTAPETTTANDLMLRFLDEQKNLAVVMDEFGGTAGIVSMEDLIAEIFGEPLDERDDALHEQKIDDRTYLFSARLEVAYLNGKFDLGLPQGDYDTLGGLILSYAAEFPKAGDAVAVPPFTFLVLTMDENRLGAIWLTRHRDA